MMSTLAERLKEAMNGPPKVSGVALAKACGITPTSVSDWRRGKSKTMEGSHLLAAAKLLGVNSQWLADGIGPKRSTAAGNSAIVAKEGSAIDYIPRKSYDAWTAEAISIMQSLKEPDRRAAVLTLRTFVKSIGPPRNGQALSMAGRKKGAA